MTLSPLSEPIVPPLESPNICVQTPPIPFRRAPESDFEELLVYAKRYQRGDNIIDICNTQAHNEFEREKNTKYHLDMKTVSERPVHSRTEMYDNPGHNVMSKLFLSSLGFLTLENKAHFTPLKDVQGAERLIKRLDNEQSRSYQSVSVVFVDHTQTTLDEIFANRCGTKEFHEFCSGLGWGIDPATHRGYKGPSEQLRGNVEKSKSNHACYYADSIKEILFHIHTIQNHDLSGQNNLVAWKKKLLDIDEVVLIWMEGNNYEHISSLFQNEVQIIISPQSNGLYKIQTHIGNREVCLIFN